MWGSTWVMDSDLFWTWKQDHATRTSGCCATKLSPELHVSHASLQKRVGQLHLPLCRLCEMIHAQGQRRSEKEQFLPDLPQNFRPGRLRTCYPEQAWDRQSYLSPMPQTRANRISSASLSYSILSCSAEKPNMPGICPATSWLHLFN